MNFKKMDIYYRLHLGNKHFKRKIIPKKEIINKPIKKRPSRYYIILESWTDNSYYGFFISRLKIKK